MSHLIYKILSISFYPSPLAGCCDTNILLTVSVLKELYTTVLRSSSGSGALGVEGKRKQSSRPSRGNKYEVHFKLHCARCKKSTNFLGSRCFSNRATQMKRTALDSSQPRRNISNRRASSSRIRMIQRISRSQYCRPFLGGLCGFERHLRSHRDWLRPCW